MATETEFLQAMSVLTVQPGDIVVLKSDHQFNWDQRKAIEEVFSDKLGVPAVLLDNGLDIGVVREAA